MSRGPAGAGSLPPEEFARTGGAIAGSRPPERASSSAIAIDPLRADATRWTVVVPVKSLTGAKTRLAPELSPPERAALARAFALDTIEAAAGAELVARVVVVSDEPAIEGALREMPGVEVVPEVGPRGLGAAIAHGVAVARTQAPGSRGRRQASAGPERAASARDAGDADPVAVAVLLGDLPSVRATDLDAALEAAARHPLAFVPDAEGAGTTLATARRGEPLVAHFGADSAARHAAAGFADLVAEHPTAIAPRLRRDVDTASELREAVALGAGPRTATVVRDISAAAPGPRHPFEPPAPTAGADRKAAS
ncbi:MULTISPECIES: 2-phospho-L-lactate guanylyltransferase [unclassified Agromyces]|uniref:2-phospho-L-lactate guanylyltransferase n=1 Tax=unclassified Agromyces TaxID=2639701 RepID=UPI0030154AB7